MCRMYLRRSAMSVTLFVSITYLLLAVLLTGCGFHLRGKIEIPKSMQNIYLTGQDQYSSFIVEAKRALERNGVKVVKSSTDAPFTIAILNENSRRRTIAVSNNFRDAAEYELRLEIEVEIRDREGRRLMMPTLIYAERNYTNDENQIRAKEREEEQLKQEMVHDIVQQLISRLQSISQTTGSTFNHPNNSIMNNAA